MFDLLTEVKKMKTMMGLIKEDQDLESINKHAQNILNILKFSGLYSATIKKCYHLKNHHLSNKKNKRRGKYRVQPKRSGN